MKILSIINKIKNIKCIIDSPIGHTIFFQNNFPKVAFIKTNKNLPQSRAGIGNKLKTQRLIEIIAQKITKNTIQAFIEELTKLTIQIGQFIEFIASCLSSGVFGLNIFFIIYHIHLNVRNISFFVSIKANLAEFNTQYLYLKFSFKEIFSVK
jgi:hypothetical protein